MVVISLGCATSDALNRSESEKAFSEKEVGSVVFVLIVKELDFVEKKVIIDIEGTVFLYPENVSSIICNIQKGGLAIEGKNISVHYTFWAHFHLNQSGYLIDLFDYEGRTEEGFELFGFGDFYPYDRYLLNLTFQIPGSFDTANKSNIFVLCSCSLPSIDTWFDYDVVGTDKNVSIQTSMIFGRKEWATSIYQCMICLSFILLGTSLLIPYTKLSSRLTVYLALFAFTFALFDSLKSSMPPREFGISIMEGYIYLLVLETIAFAIVSIMEYAFSEMELLSSDVSAVSLKLGFLELGVVAGSFFAYYLNVVNHFLSSADYFYWISIPILPYLEVFLILLVCLFSKILFLYLKRHTELFKQSIEHCKKKGGVEFSG